MSLNMADGSRPREQQRENIDQNMIPLTVTEGRPRLNQHNHFFHFDGKGNAVRIPLLLLIYLVLNINMLDLKG